MKPITHEINFGIDPIIMYNILLSVHDRSALRSHPNQIQKESELLEVLEKQIEQLPTLVIKPKKTFPNYACKVKGCDYITSRSQGLGGHMSKKHPKSKIYDEDATKAYIQNKDLSNENCY
jgi:hypothetical protein